ncbi:hypothetical protein [Streptomyces sp. NPDC004629]|uniref:hypothetical protein n=1 Tax=Streptomyces sp. NPDC004629 TaxID=3364705 RepID=UPI0036D1EA67
MTVTWNETVCARQKRMPPTPVDPNSFGYGGPWLDPAAVRAQLRQCAVLLENLLDRTLNAERDSMNAGAHG